MPKIQYTKQSENAKRKFIRDSMKETVPVVVVPFHEGMVMMTCGTAIHFDKIRMIHDRIFFAAVGDHNKSNIIADSLIQTASNIEDLFHARDVKISPLIDDKESVVHFIAHAFESAKTRPVFVAFGLFAFTRDKRFEGVIINPCGERRDVAACAIVGDESENSDVTLSELQQCVRTEGEPMTEERAKHIALRFLEKHRNNDVQQLVEQATIIVANDNRIIFRHVKEECRA